MNNTENKKISFKVKVMAAVLAAFLLFSSVAGVLIYIFAA